MHEMTFGEKMADYLKDEKKWNPAEHEGQTYRQFWGPPPDDPEYYSPFTAEEATWFQLFETVSEGTPVSPPFATEEELAEYLAKNGDFWDQHRGECGWGIERATAFVKTGWAPSMAFIGGKVLEAKDIPLTLDNDSAK